MSASPYDPEARRDTPLALKLKERIRAEGPISVEAYMRACLTDPEHGYYVTRQALGASGDFITAPEISQIFGELIGLWTAVVWQQMGSPAEVNLVELGPGRGLLMADVLRAARVAPGFREALSVKLVEINLHLRAEQERALANVGATADWLNDLTQLPEAPTIVIGNEFLNSWPVQQLVRDGGSWLVRLVGLDDHDRLVFTASPQPLELPHDPAPDAINGDILALAPYHVTFADTLRTLSERGPLAALMIDYGHLKPACGDSLQSVRQHRFEHVLTSPGEADITAHVDFAGLTRAIRARSLAVDGPVSQVEFLAAIGIVERASRLMNANPAAANEIETGIARLVAVPGMGDRFKAIGLRSTALPPLPGF